MGEDMRIALNYKVAAVQSNMTNDIYEKGDWAFFRSLRDEYLEMFKANIDTMIDRSGLTQAGGGSK